MFWLYILLLLFIGILFSLVFVLVKGLMDKKMFSSSLERVLFLVMMPKSDASKDESAQKDEKVLISQMEQVFANFIYAKKPSQANQNMDITLEIASETGGEDISFYVCVPKYLETVFEKYVQGVYPKAIVDKVPKDYTVFEPKAATAGAYLRLKESHFFPISTYQKLEKDPIASITNSLSKISEDEGAAVQIVIRPIAAKRFKKIGEKILGKIREGKTPRQAISGAVQHPFMEFLYEIFKPNWEAKDQDKFKKQEQGYDQAGYESIQGKLQKPIFNTNIRLVASAQSKARAEDILGHLAGSFNQFSSASENGLEISFVKERGLKKMVYDFSFRNFSDSRKFILNTEELASVYHFPTNFTETPYIKQAKSQSAAPPVDLPDSGLNLLGNVNFRGEDTKVYFASRDDRRRHFYVIGQTGTGKSAFMREMIRQDIENGEGVAVIDPHGELVEHTLANIPKERVDDVVLFEPSDMQRPIGLNMLEYEMPEQKDFAVQEMIAIFYKLFPPEIIGPMFEHYMRNAMLALMADKDNPGTLVEIPKMFTDEEFLKKRLLKVEDMVVKNFWTKEWANTTGNTRSDMLGYVVSKVGRFIENEMMRNIIGQAHSGFDLSKIMNEGKIFLANLSKGLTGEVNSSLLGLILVSKMQMAAMRRARIPEQERKDFYLYIDEFQNFTTDSISTILSEARKYRLNLIMAHQYIPQLSDEIKNAVFGNVGSVGSFRIGVEDAEFLEKQFEPEFKSSDLVNLDNFNLVLKLMLNNKTSTPFKMQTFAPKEGNAKVIEPIRKIAKLKYGKPKEVVEADIFKRSFSG